MKRILKIICAAAFASVINLAVIVLILLGLKALVDTGVFILQLLAGAVSAGRGRYCRCGDPAGLAG